MQGRSDSSMNKVPEIFCPLWLWQISARFWQLQFFWDLEKFLVHSPHAPNIWLFSETECIFGGESFSFAFLNRSNTWYRFAICWEKECPGTCHASRLGPQTEKYLLYQPLKRCWGIAEPEWYDLKLPQPASNWESCLLLSRVIQWDLLIATLEIQFRVEFCSG